MSKKSSRNLDIGSMMSFNNLGKNAYSQQEQREDLEEEQKEQIVRINTQNLESAPKEWNFYPPLEGDDFYRLVKSILVHGLLHPIVVQKNEERTMILSGHNRVRAFKYIADQLREIKQSGITKLEGVDISSVSEADYDEIFAIVKENISDADAREIIIDANYAQRQLGPRLMTKSIVEKYKLIQEKRKEKSTEFKNRKTREIVAESFKLSGRHIDRYKKLEQLNVTILDLFYEGRISLELSAKIAVIKPEVQQEIVDKYLDLFLQYPAKVSENLKASMTKKDLKALKMGIMEEKNQCQLTYSKSGKKIVLSIREEENIQKLIDLAMSFKEVKEE